MATKLKTLSSTHKLHGKRVLLRLDVNVPLETTSRGGLRVADDTRIREAVPAIGRLHRAGAKIIVVSHLGDPKGKTVASLRMHPVVHALRKHLAGTDIRVHNATNWNFQSLQRQIAHMYVGDVLFLENVRFQPGEEKNDPKFARAMASLADIYVNEAFSVSHRAHASLVAICKFLPHYAGWHLADEVAALERVQQKSKKPFVLVIGGAKVHDKIGMMIALAPKTTKILLGGVVANAVLKLSGIGIGKSKTDAHPPVNELKRLLAARRPGARGKKESLIELPCDAVVANNGNDRPGVVNFSKGEKVKAAQSIFDIGPATIRRYAEILHGANTIVWNGPMGFFEVPHYAQGSLSVARLIASRASGPAYAVVGGGESLEVLAQTKMVDDVDFRSTGGGAMLKFLAGEKMPGIEALKKQ